MLFTAMTGRTLSGYQHKEAEISLAGKIDVVAFVQEYYNDILGNNLFWSLKWYENRVLPDVACCI
ncbi:MAG: hypothetical protein SV239_03220 [Thermodesulfobacteriota bacterium]|nr:hypothetical protein [Thermodesulfobacteriota bacterium]